MSQNDELTKVWLNGQQLKKSDNFYKPIGVELDGRSITPTTFIAHTILSTEKVQAESDASYTTKSLNFLEEKRQEFKKAAETSTKNIRRIQK